MHPSRQPGARAVRILKSKPSKLPASRAKERYETLYNAAATPLLVVDLGRLQQNIQLLEVVDADALRDYLSFARARTQSQRDV